MRGALAQEPKLWEVGEKRGSGLILLGRFHFRLIRRIPPISFYMCDSEPPPSTRSNSKLQLGTPTLE